ncbi:MAG TPA: glucose-1-phosphate adenylyltransferase [Acidimicrobiales bacterium]|nr:glucose-1-phosphate adenylyltransferase [Acidimicrobiales bacterium]
MAEPRVLSIVLAGGEGKRLFPLTADRAKPAFPFAGHYRLIDFALSNLANAGYLRMVVLTQYKSHSLGQHLATTWRMSTLLDTYVTMVPAQMRHGPHWFAGSADAIFQNLNLIGDDRPEYICVFGADHIYRMDPKQMVEAHIASGAGVTVAGIRAPRSQASAFGVIDPGVGTKIEAFLEKPDDPPGLPDSPDEVFASMGNYVFSAKTLVEAVTDDSHDQESRHDLGGDIIPAMVKAGEAHVYDFNTNEVPGATERDRAYWRDVGTLDSYYEAHKDLVSIYPVFNLYNRLWPFYTSVPQMPPAKFVLEDGARTGRAFNSLVSTGCIISGGTVRNSILSPGVVVDSHALVEDSVLMHDVKVGEGAIVRRAILDKHVIVPPGARIGCDPEADRRRFTLSPNGITVLGKGQLVTDP